MDNSIYKKGLAVVLILALLIMTYIGVKLSAKEESIYLNANENIEENKEIETINQTVIIDIDGAVKNPGVYEFVNGDRVNDAIIKAGGLMENAFTQNLNKARKLVDGEKIYIPIIGEINEDMTLLISNESSLGKINLNTATKETLLTLDGIGDIYADRIIDYRNNKKFETIEEVKNVKGIGDKTFDKIKDFITIN